MKTWWVVRHRKSGDFVSPNRKMVPGILAAGCWDEDRARAVADVDRKMRQALRLVDALRQDRAHAVRSVADTIAEMLDEPEITDERPDGYLFRVQSGGSVVVSALDGARIGEVHSFGHSEGLVAHPQALAHARWLVANGGMIAGPGL